MLRNETVTFLQNDKVMQSRQRRGAHVGALAMAGIGVLGSGLMMGGSAGCGLTGIFGSCQDQARTNAANIDHISTITTTIVDYVAKMQTTYGENFFNVSNKLAEIEEAQQQTTETQNNNWKIIEEQFQAINTNFQVLRDCTQMLFSREQLNFNFDTTASLLSLLYSDMKSYSPQFTPID